MYKILIISVIVLTIAVGALGKLAWNQSKAYSLLKDDFESFKGAVTVQLKAIEGIETFRSMNRKEQEKSDTKLRNDSKRANVVAAKPKLVEKQINDSFNKLSAQFTKETQ